jgi:putative PIN family toxin of toxin-antitoxin system
MRPLVLDTNIVLDLFVFDDAQSRPLKAGLERGDWGWVATQAMRDELERVLDYPHICSRLALSRLAAADVLAAFDRHARVMEAPPTAGVSCSDPDDQKFIDLAVQNKCLLLSKDAAVLTMNRRLAVLEVSVLRALPALLSEP